MTEKNRSAKKATILEPGELLPIVVDLDGTFVLTDTLIETLFNLFKSDPKTLFLAPFWLLLGKAGFKEKVAAHSGTLKSNYPINQPLLKWLLQKKSEGHQIALATAANKRVAEEVCHQYKDLFSFSISSDRSTNLSGRYKLAALKGHFPKFVYVGNAKPDLAVWQGAEAAVIVGNSKLRRAASKLTKVIQTFPPQMSLFEAIIKSIRPHQWAKNLLLFLPLFLAHKIADVGHIPDLMIGFLSFSLIASAVYLINDLSDLEVDRNHPDKKNRPIPAGHLPLPLALALTAGLITIGLLLAAIHSLTLVTLLIAYFFISNCYSFSFKKHAILDCFTLAFLYTFRIFVGSVLSGILLSYWFLSFSLFFFLSLAFAKRVTELRMLLQNRCGKITARGYHLDDLALLRSLGITTGVGSIVIYSLYIHHPGVVILYKSSILLLGVAMALLYWIARVWLIVERNEMHSDPVVFAIKDKTSYVTLLICLAFIILAKYVDFGFKDIARAATRSISPIF